MRCLACFVLVSVSVSTALAHTTVRVQQTCPLCSKAFEAVLDASGTQFGVRLDLKPLGPIAAPWAVPVCPDCKFVLYADNIDKTELEKCRKIVAGERYKAAAQRSSYHLLGILREELGRDELTLAWTFLQASWQEEGKKDSCTEDLKLALKHFQTFVAAPGEKGEKWQNACLLSGEIERRLGKFDEARKRFTALAADKDFQKDILKHVIKCQLTLIDKKDSDPHEVPAGEDAEKPGR